MKSVCCSGEGEETLLRAKREALAEESAGADGHLRLDHVVARCARVSRWVDEDLEPVLLVGRELFPYHRCDDARGNVEHHENDPLDEIGAVPEDEREQDEEPCAPQPDAEGENETYSRAGDENEERPRDARPEEHREEDPDEHDAGAEIRLQMMITHGIPTMSAGFQRSRSDRAESRFDERIFASISTTVTFAISEGWPMRWLPMASQLFVLAAVPAPRPMTRVSARRKIENQ